MVILKIRRAINSRAVGHVATSSLILLLAASAPSCSRDSATKLTSPDSSLRLEAVSPTELETTAGEPIDQLPTVIVRNEWGEPVQGIRVTFDPLYHSDSAYGDHVVSSVVKTDSRGLASPREWTLTPHADLHGLEASIQSAHLSDADGGAGHAAAFNVRVKAASPAVLSPEFVWDTVGLPGDVVEAPQVSVKDRFGNFVRGVTVNFTVTSGGGSLPNARVEAANGFAWPGLWTLGPNPGLNSIVASAPGLTSVTFNARALDAGPVMRYDLPWGSIRLIASASIALCENGTFELRTVELSDALTGEFRSAQFGKYALHGDQIVFKYATGVTEEGTLSDDRLSVVHTMDNWLPNTPMAWNFVRRN